jgi:predicted KAP-like P-loop ATPase
VGVKESILPDTPLENPEDDRLGYAPFAKNLADALCTVRVDECLVFALYGFWGSRKTSCVNFTLHYITEKSEDQAPILVRFNPWWFSGQGELLNQFFREFCVALGKEKKFKTAIKFIAYLLEIASKIPEPTGFGKTGAKTASRWLKEATKEKETWKIREEIRNSLLKQNKRILVVIDDIDRLSAEEIRSVFQVIKAVADFPKTIYLLAFDKCIVVKALESIQGIGGEDYLEKIVQVPFDLPISDRILLRKLFSEQLDIILANTPQELFDQTYWGNLFWDGIDHFLNTMRNVKRLTNALKVTYPGVEGEVHPADFVAIETIRVFCSDIYQLIRNNLDMFAGYSDTHSYPKTEDIKPFHDKWVEQIREGDKEAIVNLLKRLFPKLDAVFGGSHYGSNWESTWRKQLRICNSDIFPIYFRLAVPEGQISHGEIQTILALAKNSDAFDNKLMELSKQRRPDGSTRVSTFLERMEDYTEKDIRKEHIPMILQALFNIGDKLLVPEDEGRGLFGWGNSTRIGRIMFQLLKRHERQKDRFDVLSEAFSNGHAISMIVSEVATLGQQHGKYKAQADSEDERLIGSLHLEELEKIALQKIKKAATKGETPPAGAGGIFA